MKYGHGKDRLHLRCLIVPSWGIGLHVVEQCFNVGQRRDLKSGIVSLHLNDTKCIQIHFISQGIQIIREQPSPLTCKNKILNSGCACDIHLICFDQICNAYVEIEKIFPTKLHCKLQFRDKRSFLLSTSRKFHRNCKNAEALSLRYSKMPLTIEIDKNWLISYFHGHLRT
jgi:hypothetical protein